MKKIYILLLLLVAAGVKCYAQSDRPASKQQRIDAAKEFINKGAELSQYTIKDFLQASGYVFYPEQYSKDLQKRADKGDLKAIRDVMYHKVLTCSFYNEKETQKAFDYMRKYTVFISQHSDLYPDTEETRNIMATLMVIEYKLLEEIVGYDDMVNNWASLFKVNPGNVPQSNCYARALINAFFKSNNPNKGDFLTIGNRLLLRNTKENEDIISTILMIKLYKYQATKSNPDSWNSTINSYKKILSELTDGQITDVPLAEPNSYGRFII